MRWIVAYFATFAVFLVIDLLWLGVIARDFYRDALGPRLEVDLAIAFGFYAIYVSGLVIFAVMPSDERGRLRDAALIGGLFGFYCYATYDLTNLATLKDWPAIIAIVDIPWGVVLSASSALGGAAILRAALGPRPQAG
ncbi:MAG: DUF2177 family protein [Pseudomonadota bacterium]